MLTETAAPGLMPPAGVAGQPARRAKIVCTIGPSCDSQEMITELMRLGMDVARLNFSHGTHEEHARRIARLRDAARQQGRTICILQDLQGPKMRTGRLVDGRPVLLEPGRRLTITAREVPGTAEMISTTAGELAREVSAGERILLSDGRMSLKVLAVEGGDIVCEVVEGGMLAEHQGINVPGAMLGLPSLTEKDYADLKFGVEQKVDAIAVSFVRAARDVLAAKVALANLGADTPICAKLEKPQAIENLEEILIAADLVMVARGDLGVEMEPEKVPILQKQVIARAFAHRKPVITATQMLESMMQNPRPTRAEASDVANAVLDGSDAVMLSGETAAGRYPREAVGMMARLITETELHMATLPAVAQPRRWDDHDQAEIGHASEQLTISEAMCESMAHIARELHLGAITIYTETGMTATLISKYRPRAEVYAFAHVPAVCNRLNLLWGVRPVLTGVLPTAEQMVDTSEEFLLRTGVVRVGEVVGIVAGSKATTGSTNFIRLHRVGAQAG